MTIEARPCFLGRIPIPFVPVMELACGQRFLAVARGESPTVQEWQVVGGDTIRPVCEHELKSQTGSGVIEAINKGTLVEGRINNHDLRLVLPAGSKNGKSIRNSFNFIQNKVHWKKTA